jgi:hypothetical protein
VRRTIPYAGYVDFDGEPVNAGGVKFNFALFPCATPGPGHCSHLWVARGTWNDGVAWPQGWPSGADEVVTLPIFSGRFMVELGAAGQDELPQSVFEAGHETLYLGIQIEGRSLGALQKVVPSARTRVAERAYLADHALVADMVGDLTPEELQTRRSWGESDTVAPGEALVVETFGDATNAKVLVWEQRGSSWIAIDSFKSILADASVHAYYPFDAAEAPGRDHSKPVGQGRDLTLLDNASHDAGQGVFGASLNFNGGFATTTTLGLSLGTGLTWAAWFRPRSFHNTHILEISPSGANYFILFRFYGVSCTLSARLNVWSDYIGTGHTICSHAQLPQEKWTHVAMVYDQVMKSQLVYFNGVLEAKGGGGFSDPQVNLNYMRLGGHFGGHGNDYLGHIDEAVVFNRVLSADEIADLHRYGVRAPYELTKGTDGQVTLTNRTEAPKTLRVLVVK